MLLWKKDIVNLWLVCLFFFNDFIIFQSLIGSYACKRPSWFYFKKEDCTSVMFLLPLLPPSPLPPPLSFSPLATRCLLSFHLEVGSDLPYFQSNKNMTTVSCPSVSHFFVLPDVLEKHVQFSIGLSPPRYIYVQLFPRGNGGSEGLHYLEWYHQGNN